jgi:hypothetical protein
MCSLTVECVLLLLNLCAEEYMDPPEGLAEAHRVCRVAIDGWPGDVVVVRLLENTFYNKRTHSMIREHILSK